jgi:hypothetical protein
MATLKAASAGTSQAFSHWVLQATILAIDHLVDVLEDNDEEPDNGKQEGAECETPEMIPEHPFYALAYRRLTPRIRARCEVPDTSADNNDELGA